MKNPLFYLERVQTTINLMGLSHIYRSGDQWVLVTGSGSSYYITEEEYNEIRDFFSKEDKPEEKKEAKFESFDQIIEFLQKAKEEHKED